MTAASMLAVQAWRSAMPGVFCEYTRPGMGFLPLLRTSDFLLTLQSLGMNISSLGMNISSLGMKISSNAGGLLAAEVIA